MNKLGLPNETRQALRFALARWRAESPKSKVQSPKSGWGKISVPKSRGFGLWTLDFGLFRSALCLVALALLLVSATGAVADNSVWGFVSVTGNFGATSNSLGTNVDI